MTEPLTAYGDGATMRDVPAEQESPNLILVSACLLGIARRYDDVTAARLKNAGIRITSEVELPGGER